MSELINNFGEIISIYAVCKVHENIPLDFSLKGGICPICIKTFERKVLIEKLTPYQQIIFKTGSFGDLKLLF